MRRQRSGDVEMRQQRTNEDEKRQQREKHVGQRRRSDIERKRLNDDSNGGQLKSQGQVVETIEWTRMSTMIATR